MVAALSFWDYSLVATVQGSDTYKATGRCFSVAAGRISYTFALKGLHLGQPFCAFQINPGCMCTTTTLFRPLTLPCAPMVQRLRSSYQ